MRRILLASTFLIASFALATDDVKPEEGFAPLVGTDLTGWKVALTKDKDKAGESLAGKAETPTKRFTLADGVLTIDPKVKGDVTIFTEKTFDKDAHVKFEFKPGKGCNNDLY